MVLFYIIIWIDLYSIYRIYSLLRLFKLFTYILATKVIKSVIIERVRKNGAIKIKTKFIKNIKTSNIRILEMDVLESSTLISILPELYFLLWIFLRFILFLSLKVIIT